MGTQPESGDFNALPRVADTPIGSAVIPANRLSGTRTFPRSARLLAPGTFTAVFEKRSARRGRFFHLHLGAIAKANEATGVTAATELGSLLTPRLGIAVPKKLLKTAVHRNLVKRIAREAFRNQRATLIVRDYVLRLSVKLNPKKQPLDRTALAADVAALLSGQHLPRAVSELSAVSRGKNVAAELIPRSATAVPSPSEHSSGTPR